VTGGAGPRSRPAPAATRQLPELASQRSSFSTLAYHFFFIFAIDIVHNSQDIQKLLERTESLTDRRCRLVLAAGKAIFRPDRSDLYLTQPGVVPDSLRLKVGAGRDPPAGVHRNDRSDI
jgi:hypothetical protein